jgi:thioredoxin reductase
VGLIVSYQLLQAGAEVVAIVEAAPRVGGYGVHAAKLRRAGVPIWLSHTVTEVLGKERVEAAVLARLDERWKPIPGTHFLVEADTVCLAAGLTPQADLARMAGCRMGFWPELGGFVPVHDEEMRTSQPGIYVAGDVCGVEEASTAIEEGRLAGLSFSAWLGKLDRHSFEERKQEVLARLGELRGGPFGSPRASAKAKMAEVAREACRATRT